MDLPAGYTWRRATPDDVAAVLALGLAVDVEEYGEPDWEEADVREDWSRPRFDLGTDSWLVEAPDGSVAAYAAAWDKKPHELVIGDAFVHPEAPDLYPWLVATISRRTRDHAALSGAATAHVFSSAPNVRRAAALRDAGYEVCRVFRRMVIDLDGALPSPAPGAGVAIRRVVPDDLPDCHRILTESFSEHFGTVPQPYDVWYATTVASETYRPEFWWLAEVDGAPAAVLIGQQHDDLGWVKSVGTLKSARGRGAGTALLLTAFHAFREAGHPRVGLGVDSDNATGAMALYERVGMRAAQRYDCWQRVFTRS